MSKCANKHLMCALIHLLPMKYNAVADESDVSTQLIPTHFILHDSETSDPHYQTL
jgi:hypothetical protein